ncbi:hypothetical protein KI387_039083, partial [Taxus chinensis]
MMEKTEMTHDLQCEVVSKPSCNLSTRNSCSIYSLNHYCGKRDQGQKEDHEAR